MPSITQTNDVGEPKTIELRVVEVPAPIHRRLRMHALGTGKTNSEIVIALLDARLPEYPMETTDAA